jgi:hypothetical protein
MFIKAMKMLGYTVKVKSIRRGERGVNFLARYYSPLVWYGSPNSCCDIERAARKFHTCLTLPAGTTPIMKLKEKALALYLTDANTPMLGVFMHKALDLTLGIQASTGDKGWWSCFDKEDQYPNENVDGWMDHEFELALPKFDLSRFEQFLMNCDIDQLLTLPLFNEDKPTEASEDAVVDGELLIANFSDVYIRQFFYKVVDPYRGNAPSTLQTLAEEYDLVKYHQRPLCLECISFIATGDFGRLNEYFKPVTIRRNNVKPNGNRQNRQGKAKNNTSAKTRNVDPGAVSSNWRPTN